MTNTPIEESGMVFGPFTEGHCFHIENCESYKSIRNDGVKIAEFLLLRIQQKRMPVVFVVEAKSSAPNRSNNQLKFDSYIQDIREKFSNTLALFIAIYLQRHPTDNSALSDHFRNLDLANVEFRLILVIKTSEIEWLPPLNDALQKALKPTIKIWNLGPKAVIALNEELAKKYGLINA